VRYTVMAGTRARFSPRYAVREAPGAIARAAVVCIVRVTSPGAILNIVAAEIFFVMGAPYIVVRWSRDI